MSRRSSAHTSAAWRRDSRSGVPRRGSITARKPASTARPSTTAAGGKEEEGDDNGESASAAAAAAARDDGVRCGGVDEERLRGTGLPFGRGARLMALSSRGEAKNTNVQRA
jgi:hypothetical protein